MKRCTRCIMPDTVPGITFDENGLCSYCQGFRQEPGYGRERLDALVAEAKRMNRKYDCIVPVSGGRDSTYILYVARKMYDMNVLAVNYDNEFAVEEALDNVKRACRKLGADFVSIRSRRDIAAKVARYSIRAASEFGQFRECAACTYGYRSVTYRMARKHRAPLIFWGESKEEATQDMELNAFEVIRDHPRKYLKLLNPNFYLAEYFRLMQRLEFHVSIDNTFRRQFEPVFHSSETKEVRVFDYLPWDRKKIKDTIMNELDWRIPEGHVSSWKTDCALLPLTNFYYIKLFGCTKTCFGYCRMINSGQMERDVAMRQEQEMLAGFSDNLYELLEKQVGLTHREADRIVRHPTPLYP